MSPQFKGIIGLILSVLFFFPWVGLGILHVELSTPIAILATIVIMLIAGWLGLQARKSGARILGTLDITLSAISIILSLVNLVASR